MNTANCKVLISAGLGNQLFQYSFAHFLQSKLNKIVVLENKIAISNDTDRKFELNDLSQICTHLQLRLHRTINHKTKIGKFLYRSGLAIKYDGKVLRKNQENYILEKDIAEDLSSTLENKHYSGQKTLILDGYWQKWNYVYENSSVIFSELTKYLNSQISTHRSIQSLDKPLLVVHIRRGDYLSPRLRGIIGTIDIESYISQIMEIKNMNKDIRVLTLTDSLELDTFANHTNLFGTVLGPNDTSNWQALKIMSRANYLIAANSTFSWWGGFLSAESGGQVLIPNQWFIGKDKNFVNNYKYPKFKFFDAKINS